MQPGTRSLASHSRFSGLRTSSHTFLPCCTPPTHSSASGGVLPSWSWNLE
jgi:hypothetical protein